jgi:tRNA dimethylallyltransferase
MPQTPLIAIFGPTASGKTALSLALAERFSGEILSCDSVAVYRHMDLGTAKPSPEERARVPHHLLDLYDPNQTCTAGDYARHARTVLANLAERDTLPIISGGTGLYLRALLDGLFPAPPQDPALRTLLRHRAGTRGANPLHRTLQRLDPTAAALIHPNDVPKVIRAIEVSLAARKPITEQWQQGRDALTGYNILRLGLDPPRAELYARINARAARMFQAGLVEETRALIDRFGADCRPFTSLGYAQAAAILNGSLTQDQAIAAAQQGHRNYAKRQMTWFRREAELHPVQWLRGAGDASEVITQAIALVDRHLQLRPPAAAPQDRPPT